MPHRAHLATLIALLGSLASGCASTDGQAKSSVLRPAAIHHLVFVGLLDPVDVDAIIADSDALLATIPSVTTYWSIPIMSSSSAAGARARRGCASTMSPTRRDRRSP